MEKIIKMYTKIFENFCSDIIQTMKCFALENFKLIFAKQNIPK